MFAANERESAAAAAGKYWLKRDIKRRRALVIRCWICAAAAAASFDAATANERTQREYVEFCSRRCAFMLQERPTYRGAQMGVSSKRHDFG